MIIRSPYPDLAIPDTALPAFVFEGLGAQDADRPAITDTAGNGYTYGQLVHAVGRVAAWLAARGLGRGDVAALFCANCPDYPVLFHGVLAAGAVASPANALYTPAELAHQLRDARARVLFTSATHLERARAAVAEAGVIVQEIVVLGEPAGVPGPLPETAFAEVLATDAPAPDVAIGGDDLAALPYSSGTTGLPKGVMLTHRNLVASVLQTAPLHRLGPDSRVLAVLPLFHIYGITGLMNIPLRARARVVTMERFGLVPFLAAIERHRVDHLYIAPPVALHLIESLLVDTYDLSSVQLVTSAAAPLDSAVARALAKRLDATVVQGYGLTESSPTTHGIPADRTDLDRGSIGVLMPNMEARVVDPVTGEDAAPGGRGELWCRGPNVMRGYLGNPRATAATVDTDGFLRTGDVVTVDEQGVFHVVDRLKELIKYRGHQVAPAELEALLLTHEGIADAAVIGVRHGGEEVPKAFVVRAPTHPGLTSDEVSTYVAARVAPYKKVRLVEFLDEIPKSPSGKILRRNLRTRTPAP
ncbi:AMP-binding protein [Streptomyces sp. NPDC001941]|uniref:AMP-binding protein n=1 Tax=Streptomyces sp. NPDC001941 TaxID=3154659 RepID=UPI00332A666E